MKLTNVTAATVQITVNKSDLQVLITALATGSKVMGDRAREIAQDAALHYKEETQQRANNLSALLGEDSLKLRALAEALSFHAQ